MRSSGVGLGLSFAAAALATQLPFRFDPYTAFNFVVELEGLLVGGFTEVSGLESQIEMEDYREGGVNNYIHYFPAQTTQSNLVLTKGVTGVSTLFNWYYETTQGIIQRKSGTIMMLDSRQFPVMWWNFYDALPTKWTGPQLNANSDEVVFESIELVHEGISKPLGSQLLGLAQQFF
jgi:phage tail-like protein